MSKFKKLLSLTLAFVLLFSMTACGGSAEPAETAAAEAPAGAEMTYTVSVESMGGMIMDGVDVYIYADDTLSDLKQYGETDENGVVTFTMAESADYAIVLSGLPEGYILDESYKFSGNQATLRIRSELIAGENLSGATLGLGDVMYDFSVLTPSGESVTLSKMLEEKEVVLLNFFFTTCGPCANEFP